MKEMNISDEMLSRFLEGRIDAYEDMRLLQAMEEEGLSLDNIAAIGEAAKLADKQPYMKPDMENAEEHIKAALKDNAPNNVFMDRRKSRMRVVWALAASAALVLVVSLFVLFRPDGSDQNFVQNGADSTVVTTTQPQQEKNQAQTTAPSDNVPAKPQKSSNASEETAAAEETIHITQVMDKQYAQTQTVNSLKVIKPSKDAYRVLCKNLEKTLNFEWLATNVQSLKFTITDSKGKTVAEISEKTIDHYSLKYSDVYPEKNLTWSLSVVFQDGSREARNGQIRIDYSKPNE